MAVSRSGAHRLLLENPRYESTVRPDYDVRRLPGSLRDWSRLVTALSRAIDDTVETLYLERKSPIDLSGAEGIAQRAASQHCQDRR